ncbi:hypothetical protein [Streptomyces sp. SAS_270]|uniref:hypothetical protein n=1 Tax=Streptomyces sp. SAS_270 TaxID=3412748 RepID=UPI00403CBD60
MILESPLGISVHVLDLSQCPAVTVRANDPAVEAGWRHPAAAGRNAAAAGVPAAAADSLREIACTAAELHGMRVHAVPALPLSHPHAVPSVMTAGATSWRNARGSRPGRAGAARRATAHSHLAIVADG